MSLPRDSGPGAWSHLSTPPCPPPPTLGSLPLCSPTPPTLSSDLSGAASGTRGPESPSICPIEGHQKSLFLRPHLCPVVPDSGSSPGWGNTPADPRVPAHAGPEALCCVSGEGGGGLAGQHARLEAGHPAEEAGRGEVS